MMRTNIGNYTLTRTAGAWQIMRGENIISQFPIQESATSDGGLAAFAEAIVTAQRLCQHDLADYAGYHG